MVTADTRYQFVSHFISSRRSFLRFNGTVDRRGHALGIRSVYACIHQRLFRTDGIFPSGRSLKVDFVFRNGSHIAFIAFFLFLVCLAYPFFSCGLATLDTHRIFSGQ